MIASSWWLQDDQNTASTRSQIRNTLAAILCTLDLRAPPWCQAAPNMGVTRHAWLSDNARAERGCAPRGTRELDGRLAAPALPSLTEIKVAALSRRDRDGAWATPLGLRLCGGPVARWLKPQAIVARPSPQGEEQASRGRRPVHGASSRQGHSARRL